MLAETEPNTIQQKFFEATSATYDPMDYIFTRFVAGEFASVSNSWPGDYGEPTVENLDKAQLTKFRNYFEGCNLKEGDVVLDVGSGFGPILHLFKKWGVRVIGLCPALKKYEYLKANGFEVYRDIWQTYKTDIKFNAILCVGSPEHYVTIDDYVAGKQEQIYSDFFTFVNDHLLPGGVVAGQFMTWNGKDPDPKLFDVNSDDPMYYHLSRLTYFYPECWIPRDFKHFYSCAPAGAFEIIKVVDGREHYVWTMTCWGRSFRRKLPLTKWLYVLSLLSKTLYDKDFRYWVEAFWQKSNQKCFENGWMGHEFFFLRKV